MFKFFYCVFIGFFLLVGTNCINPVNFFKGGAGTGGIYGKLEIKKFDKKRGIVGTYSPTLGILSISETNLSVKPDSMGIFYFSEVKPGSHTLIARAPSVTDVEFVLEEVEVSADSISILRTIALNLRGRTEKDVWDGMKIKRIDVRRTGSMAGKIVGVNRAAVANVLTGIMDTFWFDVSDSSGNYLIDSILPGQYWAVANPGRQSYHMSKVIDIRIAPDTTSIVNFSLVWDAIPERPPALKWNEKFIKQ